MTNEDVPSYLRAFRNNTFMCRRNIEILMEIADRLLSSGDLTEKDDIDLVRQKQKDLRELAATISELHEMGLGPFPSNPPGIGYHGCSNSGARGRRSKLGCLAAETAG
jgi:hypothetical protein